VTSRSKGAIVGIRELIGSGARPFKFNNPGDEVMGTIISAECLHKRKYQSGEFEYWADGTPMRQIRVVIQTGLRDDAEDEGCRSVYVKAWGSQLRDLRTVVHAAGDTDLHEGGTFGVAFTGYGQVAGGGNPPKLYSYHYAKPPESSAVHNDRHTATAGRPDELSSMRGD
jgi:hypothetical protein